MTVKDTLRSNSGPLLRKALSVAAISVAILIPLAMLKGLISERAFLLRQAESKVASGWGGYQRLGGPILSMQLVRSRTDKRGWTHTDKSLVYLLPDRVDIRSRMKTERRYVGIYTVPIYRTEIEISGTFKPDDFKKLQTPSNSAETLKLTDAKLFLPVSKVKAIQALEPVQWAGEEIKFEAGGIPIHNGVHARIGTSPLLDDKPVEFSVHITLAGSQGISFLPLARSTQISLTSDWPHPSFQGAFLPAERSVQAEGFDAHWQILELNRNYGQSWTGDTVDAAKLGASAFGVSLYLPADIYQRNERAVKYAFLFVAMTFLSLFLLENLAGPHLHAVQYGLIGLALSVFYLLLLALSEYVPFIWAYGLGTTALVALTGTYLSAALRSPRKGLTAAAAFLGVYILLYVIIVSEQAALLIGSLSLFAVLALVMIVTRHIDWHQLGNQPP